MGKKIICTMFVVMLLCVVASDKVYAIKGCDVSSLTTQENFGVVYNECGVETDMLEILYNHGITLARIRLFVNPDTTATGTAMNLAYVTTLSERCKAAGMKVMLAFHYSDTWADPSAQTKPSAWSSLTQAQLVTQIYDYTYSVCYLLQPDYVQIGNETTCGMLWPNGEVCSNGNWSNLRALINSAYNAVKAANSSAITVIHVSETSVANLKWFFDNLTAGSVSFDAIGISYYPEYHGSISVLSALNTQAASYGKSVMICEIGDYYYGTGYSETTQATFVTNVLAVNSNAIYWEPGWVWDSSVGYRALFKPIDDNWQDMEMTAGLVAFGGSSCSSSNVAPTVSITSPTSGATYTAPASITISASASDSDGSIASVAFYQGTTLLSTDTSSPYSYTWSSVAAGTYSLTAVATDDDGATTTSSAVSVTVNASGSVPTYQAVGAAVGGTGAISPAWPTHQSGDVALLVVETANQAVTLSTAAGFTAVTNSPQGTGTAGGSSATRLTVFWKRATSSAEATPTIADSGDHQIAKIITFRGVTSSGDPWDITAGSVASSAGTSVSIPTVTTTVANTLVVTIVANATDTSSARTSGWTNSNLTSLTERMDNNTTNGNGGGFGVATGVKAAAGATGATTATLATSSVQGKMTIALKP